MAIPYYGDFAEDDTVNLPFNTFDSNDPTASVTITNLADSDIHVHKDGSETQAVTDGATVNIDHDGITGNHMITIDTSAHAYYATGSEYAVRIEGTTVDGGTINAWVGAFSIERAGGALALMKTRTLTVAGTAVFQAQIDAIITGTAQAATSSTLQLADSAVTSDDIYNGALVRILSGTGAGQSGRIAHDSTALNDTLDVSPNWDVTPDATSVYEVIQAAPANTTDPIPADVIQWNSVAVATPTQAGVPEVDVTHVAGSAEDIATATALATTDQVADAIKVVTDKFVFTVANIVDSGIYAISGDTTAADRLEAMMDGVLVFQVNGGTPATTSMVVDGDVDDATDDHYNGRLITGLTGANAGQQTDVTAWNGTSKLLTFTALTGASANDDFWIMH